MLKAFAATLAAYDPDVVRREILWKFDPTFWSWEKSRCILLPLPEEARSCLIRRSLRLPSCNLFYPRPCRVFVMMKSQAWEIVKREKQVIKQKTPGQAPGQIQRTLHIPKFHSGPMRVRDAVRLRLAQAHTQNHARSPAFLTHREKERAD